MVVDYMKIEIWIQGEAENMISRTDINEFLENRLTNSKIKIQMIDEET